MKFFIRFGSTSLITFIATLHLLWALSLVFETTPLHPTPMFGIEHFVTLLMGAHDPLVTAVLLLGSAASACCALGFGHRLSAEAFSLLLIPQLWLVLLSAYSSANAIYYSRYADLEPRPVLFIFRDQIGYVILPLFQAAAMWRGCVR